MKINSSIVTAVLALTTASMAHAADKYIYMSGSTAARNSVYTALTTPGDVLTTITSAVSQGNATAAKGDYQIIIGTFGADTYHIKTHWSGSEGGIGDLDGATPMETFLVDGDTSNNSDVGPFENDAVDLAMADAAKAFSKPPGPSTALQQVEVGVIPFMFVKEKGSAADLTNLTDGAFRQAIVGGAKLALFTGNVADTSYVYISGRDDNSGTRVNCFGDTAFGIFNFSSQVELDSSGNMLDPNGDSSYVTEEGYSSGGSVATQMGVNCSATVDQINGGTGISVIGYLGVSDATTALGLGATQISYNGVLESANTVEQGQYQYWGNEYILAKETISTQAQNVFNALSTAIGTHADGSTFIKFSDMKASRGGPTSDPVHP